jgi:hypothetical protein
MSEIPGFNKTLEQMQKIMKAKNADYAGSTDPFKNFKQCETLGICSVEKGILVRMSDKMSRISTLIGEDKENAVADEKIEDTLIDLATYSIILRCYLNDKKMEQQRNK